MKIIIIVPMTNGVYKDDTTMFCEGLEKYHGHEIIRAPLRFYKGEIISDDPLDIEQFHGADLVWAPYEPLIPVALSIKISFGIPVVGHFEVIPPGRLNLEDVDYRWMMSNEPDLPEYYKEYKFYAEQFDICDVKTCIDDWSFKKTEMLLGRKIHGKWFKKPYPLDDEMLESYKGNYKKKNQICSILRLVPHKKIHHVLKALSKLDNPPKYVVVGKGSDDKRLKEMAEQYKLDVEFKGLVTDEEKAQVIQESMFAVQPWSWLPMGECAFYKTPCLVYDNPDTRLKMGNLPVYTEMNNIDNLAKNIKDMIENKKFISDKGKEAHKLLMENKTDIHTLKEATRRLNEIFKEVKKNENTSV